MELRSNGNEAHAVEQIENPVHGIFTQEEFDALPSEQKATGTYFVDDGLSIPGYEEYSTDEKLIGKWIDGKPLYRMVLNATVPSNNAGYQYVGPVIPNLDKVCRFSGVLYDSSSGTQALPMSASSGAYINIRIGPDKRPQIACNHPSSDYTGCETCLVLEYTKTTD